VGLQQTVFEFGKYAAEAAVFDALTDAQKANADVVGLDVRYGVEEAYFAVLAAKAILRASEEAFVRAQVHRDLAFAGVKSGLREPIELTRAEAQLSRIDAGRVGARGSLENALVSLAATMGEPDLALDTTDAPPPLPELPPEAKGIELAFSRDPALRFASAQLKSAAAHTKAIWAEYRPELGLQGVFYSYAGGAPPATDPIAIGNGWLPTVPNYALGLVLTIPLLDFSVIKRGEVSEAQERVLEGALDIAEQRLSSNVRQGYVRRDVALAALPSLERSLHAAEDNWAQADARFRAGLGTSVELVDAEALREDAQIQLALGQFNLARARIVLARDIAEGLEK
jgi:outer membrane protein TolC